MKLIWSGINYDALLFEARALAPSGHMADKLHAARHALTQHPKAKTLPLYMLDQDLHQEWMRHRY